MPGDTIKEGFFRTLVFRRVLAAAGNGAAKLPAFYLVTGKLLHLFFKERIDVHKVRSRPAVNLRVPCPGTAFPGRAIGGHIQIVALLTLTTVPDQLIDQLVGAGKVGLLQIGVDGCCQKVTRKDIAHIALQLHIAKAEYRKGWAEALLRFAFGDIPHLLKAILHKHTTQQIFQAEYAVFYIFSVGQNDLLPCYASTKRHVDNTRKVLPKIQNQIAGGILKRTGTKAFVFTFGMYEMGFSSADRPHSLDGKLLGLSALLVLILVGNVYTGALTAACLAAGS